MTDTPGGPNRGPFVGLRPFERHEQALFFGRSVDARLLVNKVLSARLTLLYGRSGLGKSSLLRALAIPQLEEEHAIVVYFDAWSVHEPIDALKQQLADIAAQLGVPNPSGGHPTLIELVGLIESADDRGVVLVLDQFEELLVQRAEHLDEFGRELALLVQSSELDLHVVLSLREEFLAALEPLRRHVITLFHSTYRLAPLTDEDLLQAIIGPVEVVGGQANEEFARQLTADLRDLDEQAERSDIDLPMLQLLCSTMWDRAEAEGHKHLSLSLYEKAGGANRVLEGYVRNNMPVRLPAQCLTEELLRYLAPHSGLKISCSLDDLMEMGVRANREKVETELKRLAAARLLRSRSDRGGLRYELAHDALGRILQPWRENVTARARRRKVIVRTGTTLVTLGLIAVCASTWRAWELERAEHRQESNLTIDALDKACNDRSEGWQARLAARFDIATIYMLWAKKDPDRIKRLGDLLLKYKDCRPDDYGIDYTGLYFVDYPEQVGPLTFHYSDHRDLFWDVFTLSWQSMAKGFASGWGIPVQQQLNLATEPNWGERRVGISAGGAEALTLEMPNYEGQVFLANRGLTEEQLAFWDYFDDGWERITDLESGGPWFVVPRWTLPVWKVSGHLANDGSSVPTILLANELVNKHPEYLLLPETVEWLLNRFEREHPSTVAEAIRVRGGERLRQDLVEVVRTGRGLTHLDWVLDRAAAYPDLDSKQLAEQLDLDLTYAEAQRGLRLSGVDAGADDTQDLDETSEANLETSAGDPARSSETPDWLREVEGWLPEIAQPIRVYLGTGVEQNLTNRSGSLVPEVHEALQRLRDAMLRDYGIAIPGVRFKQGPELGAGAIRIELFDQNAEHADAAPLFVDDLAAAESELHRRIEDYRVLFLDAERVKSLLTAELESSLSKWLQDKYSLTDLKVLLRVVVDPEDLEPTDARTNGHSLAHPDWLLRSLVFWGVAGDPWDADSLAQHLRELQGARLSGDLTSERDASNTPADDPLHAGIEALLGHDFTQAESLFRKALESDQHAAIERFTNLWVGHLSEQLRDLFERSCAQRGRLTQGVRIALEDFEPRDGNERRQKALCLYTALEKERPFTASNAAMSILDEFNEFGAWPADEAIDFAEEVMRRYDPARDPDELIRGAADLYAHGFSNSEDNANGQIQLFLDLTKKCNEELRMNWCWDLSDRLTTLTDSTDILVEATWKWSYRSREEHLKRALQLGHRAQKALDSDNTLDEERRVTAQHWIDLAQAVALTSLGSRNQPEPWREAEKLLEPLKVSASPVVKELAYSTLTQLLIQQQRYQDAELLASSGLETYPDSSALFNYLIICRLQARDPDVGQMTADWVRKWEQKVEEAFYSEELNAQLADAQWVAAIAQSLSHHPDWEVTARDAAARSDYANSDYAKMLVYAYKLEGGSKLAERYLEERWQEIDPATWDARIRAGDVTAWTEHLIGSYLGRVDMQHFKAYLTSDAAFAGSPLFSLPKNRTWFLCEFDFYEALLARAQGHREAATTGFRSALQSCRTDYWEHHMAAYLVRE